MRQVEIGFGGSCPAVSIPSGTMFVDGFHDALLFKASSKVVSSPYRALACKHDVTGYSLLA